MFMDRSIDPTGDQVRALRDAAGEGPITMVNLLRFRLQARYDDDAEPPCTGREAYARYEHALKQTVAGVSGVEIVFQGPVQHVFIGRAGQPETDWDEVLIARYPSRRHFLAMMADPRYKEALRHRWAGLERTVLLQCSTGA